MPSVGTQLLTILSKNPAHVAYVKNWLAKYAGSSISSSEMNDVFSTLYNWYYYYIHDMGYPFPVVKQGGAFDDATTTMRNEISGASGITSNVVNQFLYAMFTGYNQGKLSAEFAFPRDNKNFTVTGTTPATGTKSTSSTTAEKIAAVKNSIRWIPDNWTQPAQPKANGTMLTYGILAALAAGVYFFTNKKKGR
jgi:hypothetical protein